MRLRRVTNLTVFCSIKDVFRADIPGVNEVAEVDLRGRKTGTLCLCHPDVRGFWTALATDLCTSYAIDGILFFNERNGPLLNALGASHAQSIASSRVTCFCKHHQRVAKERGVDATARATPELGRLCSCTPPSPRKGAQHRHPWPAGAHNLPRAVEPK